MDSRQNLSGLGTNFIERSLNRADGCVLKKHPLKKWIYDNGYTQSYVAKKINVDKEEFKRKLREKEKFNERQIRLLVNFMQAEAAFKVIYFPTVKMRRKVWWEVFGRFKEKVR